METELTLVREQIARMAADLFVIIGIPFNQTTEWQRQVLGAFLFGMLFAEARLRGLTAPEIHAVVICLLMDVLKYADHQAAAFAQQLMDASSIQSACKTTNAIIHRGIDGHYQWQKGLREDLRLNVLQVFEAIANARKT